MWGLGGVWDVRPGLWMWDVGPGLNSADPGAQQPTSMSRVASLMTQQPGGLMTQQPGGLMTQQPGGKPNDPTTDINVPNNRHQCPGWHEFIFVYNCIRPTTRHCCIVIIKLLLTVIL